MVEMVRWLRGGRLRLFHFLYRQSKDVSVQSVISELLTQATKTRVCKAQLAKIEGFVVIEVDGRDFGGVRAKIRQWRVQAIAEIEASGKPARCRISGYPARQVHRQGGCRGCFSISLPFRL